MLHPHFILDRNKLFWIIIVLSRHRSFNFRVRRGYQGEEKETFWKFLDVKYY